MKIKRKFTYHDIELQIVDREENYMNAAEKVTVRRVIAPNGGIIPLNLRHKQTLKSIVDDTITFLKLMHDNGANVAEELTKEI